MKTQVLYIGQHKKVTDEGDDVIYPDCIQTYMNRNVAGHLINQIIAQLKSPDIKYVQIDLRGTIGDTPETQTAKPPQRREPTKKR